MCLTELQSQEQIEKINKKEKIIVYKVLRIIDYCKLSSLYYNKYFKLNEWNNDKKYRKIGGYGISYQTGFHCFLSLKGARRYMSDYYRYRIYQCEVKNIVAIGFQKIGMYKYKCVVAKKLRIIKQVI